MYNGFELECVYLMKCNPVQPTLNKNTIPKKNKNKNFKGIPYSTGCSGVHDWHDAVRYWEMLRHAKYLDVHSDGISRTYRYLREENYSFLERLTSYIDKSEFISRYCEFTGFPSLRRVSEKINDTFDECVSRIAKELNSSTYSGSPYSVVDKGYDPTCSVGLKKAFPGSDLDKGYIILEGGHSYKTDEEVVNDFRGALWEELDQRIVSLNHPDTFPSVYTKGQVREKLYELDTITNNLLEEVPHNSTLGMASGVIGQLLFGPLAAAMIAGKLAVDMFKYQRLKSANITNPSTAAEFNIQLAKHIKSSQKREDAKNFAFFIETVDANLSDNSWGKSDYIFDVIRNSPFVKNSNVTQIGSWKSKISEGYLKRKLKNRERLSGEFNSMDTERKYELIKDIIKYSSEDQSNKFSEYFKNDDDIKDRYESLLRALR